MEEIVIQRRGDAFEQGDVDAVLAENPVDVRTGAANVLGQLRGRYALLPHYLLDMLPDVHEKAWNLFNLLTQGFHAYLPTSHSTPKQIGVS